ncbi:MAG: elongation factor P [candidate division WOR-3 bacterium]
MIVAGDLREGQVIKLEGELYKVITAELKAGTAKFGSLVHLKLKNLKSHTFTERRFAPETKLEDVHLDSEVMDYLYADGENFYFLRETDYEQFAVPKEMIGDFSPFLVEGMKLKFEFYEGRPVNALIPKTVDLKVVATGSGIKGGTDAAYKEAKLENGMEIMVPQFIKVGDIVRVATDTKRYLERVKG